MTLNTRASRWAALESQAHGPEVQAVIAEAIEDRVIRVVPDGKGGIRIIPLEDDEDGGPAEAASDPGVPKPIPRRRFTRTHPGTSQSQPHSGEVGSEDQSGLKPAGTRRRRS
jgi:hypothetical protein